jgi:hypothetical protein
MSRSAFEKTRHMGNTPDEWAEKLIEILNKRL